MRTLRRLALGFASALTLALAGAARAGDVTYPQLGTATTVQDTDLIATWRASGPLTKVQASVLEAYLQGKLSPLFLQPGNNLSDLANVGTARTNLGLGSAATASTGTSGTTLCQLNSNCTWTGTETFNGKVTHGPSTSTGALFNLTPGAAPTSPVNGDVWMTSTGEFERVNGATQQVAYLTSNVASATNANFATTAGTANNSNALGGYGIGSFVLNNGGTYGISISGNANYANSAGSASSASSATNANYAASAGTANSVGSGNFNYQYGSVQIPTSSGTLILNWGYNVSLGGGGSYTDNFTTSYSNGAIAVASGAAAGCAANVISNTQVTIHNFASGTQNCYWIAIGN